MRPILAILLIWFSLPASTLVVPDRDSIRRVRTTRQADADLPHPAGPGPTVRLLSDSITGRHTVVFTAPDGSRETAFDVADPINLARDSQSGRWWLLDTASQVLIEVRQGSSREPLAVQRSDVSALGIRSANGMTRDPETGRLFVLDAVGSRIVRIDLEEDLPSILRDNRMSRIELEPAGRVDLRGLAFNPEDGLLYAFSPVSQTLHGFTQTGVLASTRDLSGSGLIHPAAMTFAPSADRTDDPAEMSLYLSDFAEDRCCSLAEFTFEQPIQRAAAVPTVQSSVVRVIDTSQWSPPSPDPSGLVFMDDAGTLLLSDSEVEETPLYAGVSLFETTLSGVLLQTMSTITFYSYEPTGVSFNPANRHVFVSDDNRRRVFEIDPGSDGMYDTSDDDVTYIDTTAFNSSDPEGVAYDTLQGVLFVADGVNAEVYRVAPGPNGRFDGGDDIVTSFDTESLGIIDPEGIAHDPYSGNLYLVGNPEDVIAEITPGGSLVRLIDISDSDAVKPGGLAHAPSSLNGSVMSIYVAARGVDNGEDPDENDGKIYEMTLPSSSECNTDSQCDDGSFCNGGETCEDGSCEAGTPVNCNDGVSCTTDSCNEGTDSCDNLPSHAACDDGLFCNGAETCDPASGCEPGNDPCGGLTCSERDDVCLDCGDDDDCDNGLFCDGAETCNSGTCQSGSPVNCSDGVACTADSCNEGSNSCSHNPIDAVCDDGAFCNGPETCHVALDCQSGNPPCPGQACDENSDHCLSGPTPRLESVSLTVAGSATTVALTNSYVSPVVVCSVNYNHNSIPVVTRVGAVTGNSFDVRLQNPSGGAVSADNVDCLIVEEGAWTIDGVNLEAQTYTSTVTDENNSWVGQARSYGRSYSNPVVLGQVMSENDPGFSVFWDNGGSRTIPPSASTLRTGKTVCEDFDVSRSNETVGFIVIEAGHGSIGGIEFEAALGPDGVAGVHNASPYSYSFNSAFASAPRVAITTMAAVDGVNGGWAQTHGPNKATATNLFLSIDEDTIGDAERSHTGEQVAYVAFAKPFAFDADDGGCEINADCDDGLFCNGAEVCDGGLGCLAGSDPCPGEGCDEPGDTCTGATPKLESATTVVGGGDVAVELIHTYSNPVVACSVQYSANTTPVVPRVSNVTSTGFDLRLQSASTASVLADRVDCLIVEEGVWTIDGVDIEAQTYLSSVTDENNSWVGQAQGYGQSYANPVVIGQVMSDNDPDWSVFWCQGSARGNPPSASALRTGKTVCEDTDTSRTAETVGFIVIESGHGVIGGVEFEAGLGPDNVFGVFDSPPDPYTFGSPFNGAPEIAVTTLAGIDGGNGGWAQTHGAIQATNTTLFLSIDEDTIGDSERHHTSEQVGYVVFRTAVVSP